MRKNSAIFAIILCFPFLLLCFYGSAEEITLTTYYPAPYGVYRDFETRRMVVGDDDMPTEDGIINFRGRPNNPTFTDVGAIYYNNVNNEFRYYDGSTWQRIASINATQCIRRTFTAGSGSVTCPAGYAITQAPITPASTSGNYLCCPYR